MPIKQKKTSDTERRGGDEKNKANSLYLTNFAIARGSIAIFEYTQQRTFATHTQFFNQYFRVARNFHEWSGKTTNELG
jgi:hypothetical protein